MKPFDLEAAKNGEAIITRSGDRAEFLTYAPKAGKYYQVIVLVGDLVYTYSTEGVWGNGGDDKRDLFMAPRTKTVWVNFYNGGDAFYHENVFDADNRARHSGDRIGGKAYPVEIDY